MRVDQARTKKQRALPVETRLSSPNCCAESTCPDQLKTGWNGHDTIDYSERTTLSVL